MTMIMQIAYYEMLLTDFKMNRWTANTKRIENSSEFLTACHVYFGQVMEASPNGRHKGVPYQMVSSPEKIKSQIDRQL